MPKLTSQKLLLDGITVFTDGSWDGRVVYVISDKVHSIQSPYMSAQLAELYAVLQVFKALLATPFNL